MPRITTIEEAGNLTMERFRLFGAEGIDMTPMRQAGSSTVDATGPGF
jgi:hypothetical protein